MTTAHPNSPTTGPVEHPAVSILSPSDTLTVVAWRDPTVEQASGAMRTDSDEALVTGRPHVFDLVECSGTGR